jgi:serine/threonine protein phosphatase 1
MSRILALGDIHGCLTAMQTVLKAAKLSDDDLLIGLGDYVDRGPDTASVLDWIIDRQASGKFVALRGNHELMMLDAFDDPISRHNWETVGGKQTLDSYRACGLSGELNEILESHRRFLRLETLPWYETAGHFFVHANAFPDVPLDEQPDFMLYWERWDRPARHMSGKVMVCGHASLRGGLPETNGDSICIDTGVYRESGWLTCLDVETGRYWQANQQGESRSGWLIELEDDCDFEDN